MGECWGIVINVLYEYCNVSFSLVLAVCGPDSQGVPGLLLKIQRSCEWDASTVAVDPKHA